MKMGALVTMWWKIELEQQQLRRSIMRPTVGVSALARDRRLLRIGNHESCDDELIAVRNSLWYDPDTHQIIQPEDMIIGGFTAETWPDEYVNPFAEAEYESDSDDEDEDEDEDSYMSSDDEFEVKEIIDVTGVSDADDDEEIVATSDLDEKDDMSDSQSELEHDNESLAPAKDEAKAMEVDERPESPEFCSTTAKLFKGMKINNKPAAVKKPQESDGIASVMINPKKSMK
jgi:hypothetical protein